MKNARDTRGQATVITVIFLTVLCGMVALVLDVGSWYRADRALQSEADAAALAGAQALPASPADAQALAMEYADKNGGGLDASGISFSSKINPNDTIKVSLKKPAEGFFSKLFGLDSVAVAAHAAARAAPALDVQYVAPIVVNVNHPMLAAPTCNPKPCQDPTQIDLADLHKSGSGDAAGSFGLINLDPSDFSSVGSGDLGNWIDRGYDGMLSVGNYYAVPSTKWNSDAVRSAMTDVITKGKILIFPIYDKITGPGDNAVYHVVGWVGFYVTDFKSTGSGGTVYGHFTSRIASGTQVHSAKDAPDYGLRVIKLVD